MDTKSQKEEKKEKNIPGISFFSIFDKVPLLFFPLY